MMAFFQKNLKLAGSIVANGKLSLLNTYPDNPNDRVSIFSFWNNLIGDPALLLWTDSPKTMFLNHHDSILNGTNIIEFNATDDEGLPVPGVLITLLKGNDEIFISQLTDNNGVASFDLDYSNSGEVYVTAVKQNYIPVENNFLIEDNSVLVNVDYDNIIIDDSFGQMTNGNNDGLLNPGESVLLSIPMVNNCNQILYNIDAELITAIIY